MTNLINCGTCGYPLTPEERTSLIERNGLMVKPASMTTDEALDKAQGYLDRLIRGLNMDDTSEAIQVRDAIKQARSAPVQEPVAWMQDDGCHFSIWKDKYSTIPLYTAPPAAQRPVPEERKWVGLTDEERVDLWKATETDNRMVLIDAIEAKLKERNV